MGTIVLHGWTTSIDKWKPLMDFLKKLNPKLLTIPGLTEKIDKPWNLETYISWLGKIVSKEKGKVTLIGHSNGGRISIAFTAKNPNKVSKLILIDSAGIYHKEFYLQLKRFLFKGAAKIGKRLGKSDALRNILYKLAGESDYKNANGLQRQTMVNLISVDLTEELKKIKVPTLIIWGKEDTITPLSDGELMHKLIEGSKLEVIKDARHSPQFTHPKEVAKAVYEYI